MIKLPISMYIEQKNYKIDDVNQDYHDVIEYNTTIKVEKHM